jgi:Sel1 repeat
MLIRKRQLASNLFMFALWLATVPIVSPASAQILWPWQRVSKCSHIVSDTDLANCRRLADAGDIEAMLRLATTYKSGDNLFWVGREITGLPPDQRESLRYYKLAADLGDSEALRHLFGEYDVGGTVPKNQAIADQYLNKAVQYGAEWAILLLAQRQEKSAPAKALEGYLRLARNDNCPAQRRLSDAYESGVLVKKNLTQAYFWALLAATNHWARACGSDAYKLEFDRPRLERALPPKLLQAAQDAATSWTKGTSEKFLPAPAIVATNETRPGPEANKPREAATITAPAGPKAPEIG